MTRQTRSYEAATKLSDDELRSQYNNLIRLMRGEPGGQLPEAYHERRDELKYEAYDRGIELPAAGE